MPTSHIRTTLGPLDPEESQVPSSYPSELALGFTSVITKDIGHSNYLADVLSNNANHSISQYDMRMKSSVDLPMTTVDSGGIHTSLGLMGKANFSLAEYESTKKLEKSEHMEWRRLDRETRHAERYDPCDDGSEFDDPKETQLLPEDQTLLVH
jgi:hypothetical protein